MNAGSAQGGPSSRWTLEFDKQVMRGRHVILYGNVLDQFLWRGAYLSAHDFLTRFFLEKGFDLVVRYDPIDGMAFADPAMGKRFRDLIHRRIEEAHPGLADPIPSPPLDGSERLPSSAGGDAWVGRREESWDAGRTAPPGGRSGEPDALPRSGPAALPRGRLGESDDEPPRGRPAAGRDRPLSRRLPAEEAFGQLRLALSQSEAAVATIVDMGDLLTSDATRFTAEERAALALLKKCSLEAAILREGPRAGYRNTMVVVAGELNRVPEWLYRENPFVALLHAARPGKDERRQFAVSFIRPSATTRGFFGGDRVPEGDGPLDTVAEAFADLSEGFQAWDLEALRRTSWVERIPIGEPHRLIDFYKFGVRDDPWAELSREKVADATSRLSRRVIGQPHAVDAVTSMLTSARIGLTLAGPAGLGARPKGVFFFVGPTGVGKTELAKAVTELVFGDERAFARFDMSEYKEEHAAEKLAGAPPGFVGYEEGGQLTNRVIERPHSILLFDEIEKAHPRVLDKFLQILEDGRLTDGKGQTAYFNQAAIIFTSNIGASELVEAAVGDTAAWTYEQVARYFHDKVRDYFTRVIGRAELLNRLGDSIVPFDLLRPAFIGPIAMKLLDGLAAGAMEKYGLTLRFGPSVLEVVAARMNEEDNLAFGGRRVKTLLETLVERPLNRWIFTSIPDPRALEGATLTVGLGPGGGLEVTDGD